MLRRRLTVFYTVLLAVALLGATCNKPPNAFIVSGQTVAAAGQVFLTVAAAYDAALKAGSITPAQYTAWKAVGQKIQAAYGPAATSWDAAVKVNDATKITDAKAKIAAILAELATWGTTVGVDVYTLVGQKG